MPENNSAITQTIFSTINSLFSSLYSSVDNSIYGVLDDIVFINTDIMNDSFMTKLLGTSATSRTYTNCKRTFNWLFSLLYCKVRIFTLYKFIHRTTFSIYF